MNEDQLLDAIGWIDDAKLREARTVKRTKRLTGVLVVTVLLLMLAITAVCCRLGGMFSASDGGVSPYSLQSVCADVRHSVTVRIYHDDGTYHTAYVPADVGEVLQFDAWTDAKESDLSDRTVRLKLRFGDVDLWFYDGYVRAEKSDFTRYIGVFEVPAGLPETVRERLTADT